MSNDPTEPRRHRWERAAEWPLTVSAVAFLAAYAWPILAPDLPRSWSTACQVVTWGTWALFAVDYLARLVLSRDRWAFVRSNLLDLAVIALPLLRPLRLLRLVTLLGVLNRYAGSSLRGRVAIYVAGSTALVLFVAALAVVDAERRAAGANITTFTDALWWATTTVTTVGYGDRFPVTGTGRLVAGGLMLAGIALLGVVTAARIRDDGGQHPPQWKVWQMTAARPSVQSTVEVLLAVLERHALIERHDAVAQQALERIEQLEQMQHRFLGSPPKHQWPVTAFGEQIMASIEQAAKDELWAAPGPQEE